MTVCPHCHLPQAPLLNIPEAFNCCSSVSFPHSTLKSNLYSDRDPSDPPPLARLSLLQRNSCCIPTALPLWRSNLDLHWTLTTKPS